MSEKSERQALYINYYSADKISDCVLFFVGFSLAFLRWRVVFFNSLFDFSMFAFWLEVGKNSFDITKTNYAENKPMKLLFGCSCWKLHAIEKWVGRNLCNDTTELIDQDMFVRWNEHRLFRLLLLFVNCSLTLIIFTCQISRLSTFFRVYVRKKMAFFFVRRKLEAQFHFEGSRIRVQCLLFIVYLYMSQLDFELIYHFYSKQISSIFYSTFHFIKGISNMLGASFLILSDIFTIQTIHNKRMKSKLCVYSTKLNTSFYSARYFCFSMNIWNY